MEVSSRYSFGMAQPGRSYVGSTGYNYSYNGKEKVDEWNGVTGGHYDYGFRVYDPRSARFLSLDPLDKSYPMLTPYQFAHNTPIYAIDLDGLEGTSASGYFYSEMYKVHLALTTAYNNAKKISNNTLGAIGLIFDDNFLEGSGDPTAEFLKGNTPFKPFGNSSAPQKNREADWFEILLHNVDQERVNQLGEIFGDWPDPTSRNTIRFKLDLSALTKAFGEKRVLDKIKSDSYIKTSAVLVKGEDGTYSYYFRGLNDNKKIYRATPTYTEEEVKKYFSNILIVDNAEIFFKQDDQAAEVNKILNELK